jgi:hypothetical protein
MKNNYYTALIVLLVFSGCAKKQEAANTSSNHNDQEKIRSSQAGDEKQQSLAIGVDISLDSKPAVLPNLNSVRKIAQEPEERIKRALGDLQSDNVTMQTNAIWSLYEIGDRKSIAILANLLIKNSKNMQWRSTKEVVQEKDVVPMDRELEEPLAYLAVKALSNLRLNALPPIKKSGIVTEADVSSWREWWSLNKKDFGGEEVNPTGQP